MNIDYTQDHKVIEGARATRRYFAKFSRIIEHLGQVAAISKDEGQISGIEVQVLENYLTGLANTFDALSYKFLMADRMGDQMGKLLSIDKTDSGFPIYQELLQMAADALQAPHHLKTLPSQERLKKDMINHILSEKSAPTKLQYAMSQRLYYESLAEAQLFYSQNDPHAVWLGSDDDERREYLIYWATYDSQLNLPVIYMMEVEDSARKALPRDERRWPMVQSHLMAQSVSALKLLTIARGFDQDFDDLHPKSLRRIHIGPMYSHAFTEQNGPLRDVLADASGEQGLDWALTWSVETLRSESVTHEKSGFFGSVERQVFEIDPMRPGLQGVSDIRRSLILPHRAYQVLEEKDPANLRDVRKYVVGKNSKVLSYK